ncbi:ABC transporter permease [Nitratifractor sp.]
MNRVFWAILAKELLIFLHSVGLVAVVLYSFTADIYIAGSGIQLKPRNVSVGYVDETGGGLSLKILSRLHAPEFKPPRRFPSQEALSRAIFNREVMVGLLFDNRFAKDYRRGAPARLDVLLDATAASQAFTTLSYLQNILLDVARLHLPVEIASHKLFNPNANTHYFMSLSEMLSVITLLIVILTATVFVKEKEEGTWDLMLLMPVDARLIILAKSLSQVLVVMGGILIALGFVVLGTFDTPLNGSFWGFILLSLFYSFSSAGIGLFIAAVSRNIMQVAQLSIVIMMPMIFLSGAWTPIYAMHPFFQWLSLLSPLRYYIEGSESLFFRGTSLIDLLPDFGGVFLLGILLYGYGFRKIGRLF